MPELDFASLRKSIAAVSDTVKAKTAQIANLKAERDRISKAPGTREDVLEAAMADVDRAASCYVERLQADLRHHGNYRAEFCAGPHGGRLPVAFAAPRRYPGTKGDVYDTEKALAFLFNVQIKEGLRKAFAEMTWPEGAEPLNGRDERLQALDTKIALAEADLAKLRDEAAKTNLLV
ncbi:MAG: hypothetical protein JNJ44_12390 [Zoogloeaceae bacterium]|nr:hypothetical protein [Zoogloeaceae bacterium]